MNGPPTALLPRLAAQFAAAVADGSAGFDTAGFRVHIWPTPDPFYRNVAIPVGPACIRPDAVAAMRAAFTHLKLVAEPSGAIGLGAVLAGKLAPKPAAVGVILSGGNIALEDFARMTAG